MDVPETRYAKSGDLRIAYQVTGSGPLDLVFVPGFVSNLDLGWEDTGRVYFLSRLAAFSRLILFDKRGTGLSDRTAEITDQIVDEVEEFLTGSRTAAEPDRVLATVLFTDIVDSTKRAAELGDRDWRLLRDRHDDAVREELARYRGREVKTLGDGFLATFDGPARAVRCAAAIIDKVRPLGIEVRSGLHTGEIEVKRDDVAGIAVHIAARVVGFAGTGEVLVSSTVRDLVAGSGLRFHDRGSHALKGLPEPLHLFAAEA
jgi:class 3 adenylate cyclase